MEIDVSVLIDAPAFEARPVVDRGDELSDGKPIGFVFFGGAHFRERIRLWGRDPKSFRALASALTRTAEDLEALVKTREGG